MATKQSLDLIVNNASYTRHAQKQNFLKIIENGANLRIILWDYTEVNRPSYDAFHLAIRQNLEGPRGEAQNVHRELIEWKQQINADSTKYKGTLEFRWNSSPLLYTMWVRDWGTPQSIGHLGIHFTAGKNIGRTFAFLTRMAAAF